MPFPLPKDPTFVKEVVEAWIDDVEDRLLTKDIDGASLSLNTARGLYLSLPPGCGNLQIEERLVESGVKIDKHSKQICEH